MKLEIQVGSSLIMPDGSIIRLPDANGYTSRTLYVEPLTDDERQEYEDRTGLRTMPLPELPRAE